MAATMSPSRVFVQQLTPLGYGAPQWIPECDVQLGDVGFSDTGTNLCRPSQG